MGNRVQYVRTAVFDTVEGAKMPNLEVLTTTCVVHSIVGPLTNAQLNDIYIALLQLKEPTQHASTGPESGLPADR